MLLTIWNISIPYKFSRNNVLGESLKIFDSWFKTNLNCAMFYHLMKNNFQFLKFAFEFSNLLNDIRIFDNRSNIRIVGTALLPSRLGARSIIGFSLSLFAHMLWCTWSVLFYLCARCWPCMPPSTRSSRFSVSAWGGCVFIASSPQCRGATGKSQNAAICVPYTHYVTNITMMDFV